MLEVIEPGLATTVQDMGRQHGQALGIPPSGAQDGFALRIANLLVGNPTGGPLILRNDPGAAGLEMLLIGPKLRALVPCVVAVTGVDMTPLIDGVPAPGWQALALRTGQVLSFAPPRRGARGYLAVHGGIDVPLYLGSRSTHVRGQFGGFEGRVLKAGDRLPVGPATNTADALVGRRLRADLIPRYEPPHRVRVIKGPEDHLFTEASVETFFGIEWRLNAKADRTGFRYVGPQLGFKPGERPEYLIQDAGADPSNIVIDPGAPAGTIQVPSGVEPIVLGVDAPSIGGYARIGVVISIDMSAVGQTRPGEATRFVPVSHDEAVAALRAQEALITESSVASA
ncbi:MAG: biotin-dependent carboxyltransferase family protein [Alphaproteobacteria bacterium]